MDFPWVCQAHANDMDLSFYCHFAPRIFLRRKSGMLARGFVACYPNSMACPQLAKALAFATRSEATCPPKALRPSAPLAGLLPARGRDCARARSRRRPASARRIAGKHGCNGRQWVVLRPVRHREAIFRGRGVLHEDVPAEFPNAKDMAPDEVSRVMNMIAGSSSGPPGLSQDAERDVALAAWVDVRGQRCHVSASAAEARKLGANVAANGAKFARHARGGRQRSGQRARPETQPDSPSDHSETRRPFRCGCHWDVAQRHPNPWK